MYIPSYSIFALVRTASCVTFIFHLLVAVFMMFVYSLEIHDSYLLHGIWAI